MGTYKEAVGKLYSEKEKLLILGLTGRTGTGCSTAASILEKTYDALDLEYEKKDEYSEEDEYKFDIIKEYIGEKERWIPFTKIEGSCVILSYVFEKVGTDEKHASSGLTDYLSQLQKSEKGVTFKIDNYERLIKELQGFDHIFRKAQQMPLYEISGGWAAISDDKVEEYYKFYVKEISEYKDRIRKTLLQYSCYEEKKKKIQDEPPVKHQLYTYLLQKMGNNIRASGNPYNSEFNQDKILSFAERLAKIIELIIAYDKNHKKSKSRICIDAIRNAHESNFLKDKYRPYYLISINANEEERRKRLKLMNLEEQISLDNVEYAAKLNSEELFYHQNISNCFEMADIHLVNEDVQGGKYFFLTWQLVKYITLMIHPGLITPTKIECCMQLAYNAKYNSGCLSRQVGAVVTGDDFSVKSVGWNEVPNGQLSCSLRDVATYCKGNMEQCFSEFEHKNAEFREILDNIQKDLMDVDLEGRKFSYCFKDIYNGYKKEKNQVHTRALHAEENAFLQISRYGGKGIKGGFLFCTASPCELCAKKAYQLGIKNIYYIDPYPGISQKHILSFGKRKTNPQMHLFLGAIGEAYIRLYKPLLAYKDELELVSGINCKKIAEAGKDKRGEQPETKDLLYHSIEFSIEFINREIIESKRKVDIEVVNGSYQELNRQLTWTGSSYDKSELIDTGNEYTLIDSEDKVSPYKYKILFEKEKRPKSRIQYTIHSKVKDETHLMHEYFAQMIKYPTKYLELTIIIPIDNQMIENVRYKRYADYKMEYEYADEKNQVEEKIDESSGKKIYTLKVHNPNLFYAYSLEWDFIKVKS